MTNEELKGAFNFAESFPGPHILRVKLDKYEAKRLATDLFLKIADGAEAFDFCLFGTLTRDAEEDKGNPIEISDG